MLPHTCSLLLGFSSERKSTLKKMISRTTMIISREVRRDFVRDNKNRQTRHQRPENVEEDEPRGDERLLMMRLESPAVIPLLSSSCLKDSSSYIIVVYFLKRQHKVYT
jgi:hypothetical protein